jgi:pimeloyl-ACP methyl ester carboxylesterase
MNNYDYKYSKMVLKDHEFSVPLDHSKKQSKNITIFVREILREEYLSKNLPYLIFFQGGPGYESPRPITFSGWINKASKDYKILLLDQRGTGLSTPVSSDNLLHSDDQEIANYLMLFRADNIVKDAEFIRKRLIGNNKWSILGQSFGGFCAVHYLSFYPESLEKVFITGGLPPLDAHCDDIYRSTYKRVIFKNKVFFNTFPKAQLNARSIADHLIKNKVYLPNGDLLTVKRFQQLGLSLGFSDGMTTLNYLFENAFINKELSYTFLKNFMSYQTFDTNPIFTILHEACYAQNFSTNWSAMRVLDEFSEFNPAEGKQLLFTGEMLYPWMLDIYKNLKPFKGAANILANKEDWSVLYDKDRLKLNKVPVFAAVYENDMYVDRNYSIETAASIGNVKIWETNKYEHNGLRSDGDYILSKLFNM